MMNILEKEDLIKGLPDNVLQQQMQNPTGELPQYLLISEIQRRTDMRKSLQEQPKQESVSEQIMMEGIMANRPPMQPQMPPQMPQMPMEQPPMGMAQGGVVRMANGGEVERIRQVINDLIAQGAPQEQINNLIEQLRLYGLDNPMGRSQNIADQYAELAESLRPTSTSILDVEEEPVVPIDYPRQDFSGEITARGLESRDMDAARMQAVLDESATSDEAKPKPTREDDPRYRQAQDISFLETPQLYLQDKAREGITSLMDYFSPEGEVDPESMALKDVLFRGIQSIRPEVLTQGEVEDRARGNRQLLKAAEASVLGAVEDAKGIGSLLLPEGGIKLDPKFEDMLSGEMSKMDYARYAGSDIAEPFLALGSKISDYSNKFLSEAEIASPAYYDRSYQTGIIANDPRFQERVDLYNRLKEEYGSDVAAAQAIRSAGGQAIDMAGDVGKTLAEGASEIKEASTPFVRQLFTGTQEVTPDAETSSGAGIGDIIRGLVMPGYKTNAEKNVSTDLETEAKKVANQKQNQGQKDESVVAGTTGAVSKNAGDQSNPSNVPAPDDVVDPRITDDDGLTTYTTGSLGNYENRLKGILDEDRRGGAEAMVAAGLAISEGKNIGQALGSASQAASQARDTQVERQLKAFSALSKNRQQNALLNLKKKVEQGRATRGEINLLRALLQAGTDPDYAENMARQYLPKMAGVSREGYEVVGTRPG
tara:strand:+ start:2164 stop:4290 length:2127 start_codon:yes stop_codon:yes gene_type:complete